MNRRLNMEPSARPRPWEISRRACLRGAGTAIGLPVLEAMMPGMKRARAAGNLSPRYMCILHFAGGTPDTTKIINTEGKPGCLRPSTTGADYAVTPLLQPLADAGLKNDVLVVSNLHNAIGELGVGKYAGGDHPRSLMAILTGVNPEYADEPNRSAGISVDQFAASTLKQYTPVLPSLCISNPAHDNPLTCWSGPTSLVSPIVQPAEVFRKIFGDGSIDAATARKRLMRKMSVLHYAKQDTDRLKGKLGQADRNTLDKYLESIRSLEEQITASAMSSNMCKDAPAAYANLPDYKIFDFDTFPTFLRQMLDLVALAFQCDRTRVAVLTFETHFWHFRWLGAPYSNYVDWHGDIEHGAGAGQDGSTDADIRLRMDTYAKGCTWMIEQFGYLLDKLKTMETADGSGSLLDNTMAVFTSELSYGNGHSMRYLPVIVGGRAGGVVKPGRHIAPPEQPIANLWLTMLNAVGVNASSFGNSTGPLSLT